MAADQARALMIATLVALPLALTACEGTGPVATLGRIFGPATEGRERPPGLDGEGVYPALGTVPPRPDRPDPAVRHALTDRLAREREVSRDELPAGAMSQGGFGRPAPGLPGPPSPARVGPMVAVPPAPVMTLPSAPTAPAAVPVPAPAQPVPQAPPRTSAPVAPPPAAQPPLGLGGPPPLPSPDLLAPGSGPPPAPSRDLLAPGSESTTRP